MQDPTQQGIAPNCIGLREQINKKYFPMVAMAVAIMRVRAMAQQMSDRPQEIEQDFISE
jgi:hypothetical protein